MCLSEINFFKVKNNEKSFDKAQVLKVSSTSKIDPKFSKLQETQMKNAKDDVKMQEESKWLS